MAAQVMALTEVLETADNRGHRDRTWRRDKRAGAGELAWVGTPGLADPGGGARRTHCRHLGAMASMQARFDYGAGSADLGVRAAGS